MSSADTPIILSSINPSPNSLSLSSSPSDGQVWIVYASGLVINILDGSSLALCQSINLIDHLPHLSTYCHSIDAICITEKDSKLAVSCGPSISIFERSTESLSSPWTLHSTFTSHISRILTIQLQKSFCLIAGQDGLSLHELDRNLDLDDPPRWIKRWTLRGQPCDQTAFQVLDDGTCLIVSTVAGSPILKTYEFYPSPQSAIKRRQFSHDTIVLSLPIHSIHLSCSHQRNQPPEHPHASPLLSVQVVNRVLGVGVHYYNLVRQPDALPQDDPNQRIHSGRPQLSSPYIHTGMCAISIPLSSPRILVVFPLNNLSESFILQNQQLLGGYGNRLNLVILSNGEVNLTRSMKNTSLLSKQPFILPDDVLELLCRPNSTFHSAIAIKTHFNNPRCMSCLMIVRPLAVTGELLIIEISLNDLLVPPVSNLNSRLLSMRRVPFGFTPILTPSNFNPHQEANPPGLLVTGSTKDETSKFVCLCHQIKESSSVSPRLFAYAAEGYPVTPPEELDSIGMVQAAGYFEGSNGILEATQSAESKTKSNFPSRLIGVFITYHDDKLHTFSKPLLFTKFGLKGFGKAELPKALMINGSAAGMMNGSHSLSPEINSIICLTSMDRLLYWTPSQDFKVISQLNSPPYISPRQVSFSDTLLMTLVPTGFSTHVVLALDTSSGQLIQGVLPQSSPDSQLGSFELKTTSSYSIGVKNTLGLTDIKNQVILLEAQGPRFLALLCKLNDTDQIRTYRVTILDLKQQPHSPGIVGLHDFEVEKDSLNSWNTSPQLKWSHYQKGPHHYFLKNECSLAVCYGGHLVRIYSRARDGWWKQAWEVKSKLGSVSQISWITSSLEQPILAYQATGHTFLSPPIVNSSKASLPPWHPIVLKHRFLFGNISLAFALVACLALALKGSLHPLTLLCEVLSSSLQEDDAAIIKTLDALGNDLVLPHDMSPTNLSQAHIDVISSAVDAGRIPLVSRDDRLTLIQLALAFLQVQTAKTHSIDIHGCQYIFSLINHFDHHSEPENYSDLGFGTNQDCGILFAQQSSTQSLLVQETINVLKNIHRPDESEFKLDWNSARSIGLFLWLNSEEETRTYLERIGQTEYVNGGTIKSKVHQVNDVNLNNPKEQDPAACSIFYMALKKKRLLLGLWKVAYGHSDRPLMLKFLQNDFSEPRWKTAAQKNAFALISRQRFAFAASFFLLADRLQDAVNICVRQLSDWQLGVAIARAYEGDQGPVLKNLIAEFVIPLAILNQNRWLMSWSLNILGDTQLACQILVASWDSFLNRKNWSLPSRLDLAARVGPLDLRLVLLFNRLKTRFPPGITWEEEKGLILLTVDELLNSGCIDLVGILIRNWNFNQKILNSSTNLSMKDNNGQIEKIDSSRLSLEEKDETSHTLSKSSPDIPPEDHHLPSAFKNRVLTQPVVPEFEMSNFF